jgi:hypothetical protein
MSGISDYYSITSQEYDYSANSDGNSVELTPTPIKQVDSKKASEKCRAIKEKILSVLNKNITSSALAPLGEFYCKHRSIATVVNLTLFFSIPLCFVNPALGGFLGFASLAIFGLLKVAKESYLKEEAFGFCNEEMQRQIKNYIP